MMVDHSILVVQQREERIFCMQQHLPLPLLLSLPSRVHPLLQRQDLPRTEGRNTFGHEKTVSCTLLQIHLTIGDLMQIWIVPDLVL